MIDLAIDNRVFINNNMQEAIQELDMIFSTNPGEMIGNVYFGADWYPFLNTLTPMETALKQYIKGLLADTYYCKMMDYDIEVAYIPGEITCQYVVSITLTDYSAPENSQYRQQNKIYQIK